MKEEIEYIYSKIKGIKEKSPALLMERAAILFEENYSGNIYTIETDEDLLEIIDTFSGTEFSGILVIKCINYIKDIILVNKFLDSINFPVIFLVLYDSNMISEELISRMQTVVKIPYTVGESKLLPGREGINELKMQIHQVDKSDIKTLEERIYATESPEYYYLKSKSSRYVCNDKIVDLLSTR